MFTLFIIFCVLQIVGLFLGIAGWINAEKEEKTFQEAIDEFNSPF